MRKKLTESERQQVYQKCNGHCAYCGCKLEYKDMQADHMEPLYRGGTDEISNMLPACRSCNHYKSTLGVDEFRSYLREIPSRLMRDSIPYQVGVRFGLIENTEKKLLFYFETMEVMQNEPNVSENFARN